MNSQNNFLSNLTRLLLSGSLAILTALICLPGTARAQSALDGFDPNANDLIRVVVVQPDGKILIGGDFTTLSPNGGGTVTRNHIARLNPDGTLDTAFDPNATGPVLAIAVQPDGKILAGGGFNGAASIGGLARNYIARLDATTGAADAGFDPNATGPVLSMAVQPDGKILVGGSFNGAGSIGGQARNRFARLDAATGAADPAFDPNADGPVYAITVQTDGKILIGGDFTGLAPNGGGTVTRHRIARLDFTAGAVDPAFDPNAQSTVYTIAVQADGKILAGGDFGGANGIGGQTRNYIARLDAMSGAADLTFDPNANNTVLSIAVQADGKILAGGVFTGATSIGGQTRNYIARLDAVTGAADSFDPNANGNVMSIAVEANGKILAAGFFNGATSIGGQTRNRIARMEIDGRLDQTLNVATVGTLVMATAVQPDGKILIGGIFDHVLGVTRNNIARLNSDGTLDVAFDPNANGQVNSIALQTDGKILVGGQFNGANSIGGQTRNRIARLDATTGAADPTFDPNANNDVNAFAVQPDGKILVGGRFFGANSIGGQSRNCIARLDATTGAADPTFNPIANNNVFAIALQADGKVLVGGQFSGANSIGGQTRNFIARLDGATGAADLTFNPNANGNVFSLAVQGDGKILAGGAFNGANSIGGQTRNRIARLDPTTGAADPAFDPNANNNVYAIAIQADGRIVVGGQFGGSSSIGGLVRQGVARLDATTGAPDSFNPSANGIVFSIAAQADGKILVGGAFGNIGGQTRSRFARLTNDTAALQNLAATQGTITWTLGGSRPQPTHVSFESSTDNVNYTLLGSGTPSGSNWTLTGLTLLTGQNIYVRARGFYRSGYQSGSESIAESVRTAFFVNTPPVLTYSNQAVAFNGSLSINPATGPADDGAVSSIVLQSSGTYTGTISVNNTTGVVSISNAAPVGTHTITIRATDNSATTTDASFTLTVSKANQTIIVGTHAPANAAFNSSFAVSATSTSGLPVSYSSAGSCTNVGTTFTMTASTGACTVMYDQAGDTNYNAATQVTESVSAQKASQSITVGTHAPANAALNSNFTVAATSTSGLAVTYSSAGACTNVGALFTMNSGTGTCTVKYDQAGNTNYDAAPQVTESVTAPKLDQTITFGALSNKTFGDPDFSISATATSGLTVSFAPSGQCTVAGAMVHLTGAGSCTISASQAGDTNYNAAPNVPRSFTIDKSNQTITFGALSNKTFGDPDFSVSATASSGLGVSFSASGQCTVAGATVHLTGAGSCTITAQQAGDANVNPAPGVPQSFTIVSGVLTFSQSSYNVNESAGFVTIIVTRSGDLSVPVSVDYATGDTGSSTVCGALNSGLASSRCDFGLTLGTLKFAPTEAQKTFTIPITPDSFTEGPEMFTVTLSNLVGAGVVLAAPSSATVTINDSAAPAANASDDTNAFVRQQYRDFLNREADPAGLAFWTGEIDNCTPKPQCTEVKRINVSAAFFLSIEFQTTGILVRNFYVVALNRPATNNMPGFVEFERDTEAMQRGLVVDPNNNAWQTVLSNNRDAFMRDFVTRTEFVGLYPTTDTPTQYVDKLYLQAGVTPAASERGNAIAEFGGAPTAADAGARGRALLVVTQNTTFQQREVNRSFVQMEYFGYLRRNPNDAPDGNYAGYDFWVTKLNAAGGNFINAEMVKAFISSGEYRRRFGP